MPYNTTAIPPRGEATGHTQLPLSRVKKILAADPDIHLCSNNAAFVITLAAEMFVQHIMTEASAVARAERKPRKNIQYRDMANAVAHSDKLEFLEDVVPKTVQYKVIKKKSAETRAKRSGENKVAGGPAGNGKDLKDGDKEKAGAAGSSGSGVAKKGVQPKVNGFQPRIVAGADREDRMSPEASEKLKRKKEKEAAAAASKSKRDGDGDVEMED